MIELFLTVCMIANGAECRLERVANFREVRVCNAFQADEAVGWMRKNPDWRVMKSSCGRVMRT